MRRLPSRVSGEREAVVMGAVLLGALIIATLVRDPDSGRFGQLVFVPVEESAIVGEQRAPAEVTIRSCQVTGRGLQVVGHAEPNGEVTPLLVIGALDQTAGISVATAEAVSAQLIPGGSVGDFVVVLPWANGSVTFARGEWDTAAGIVGIESAPAGCPD